MIGYVRNSSAGVSDYEEIITGDILYIDKTNFISEWRESKDKVTLITRPRRFGKTLNMSTVECFFPTDMQGAATCLKASTCGNQNRKTANINTESFREHFL